MLLAHHINTSSRQYRQQPLRRSSRTPAVGARATFASLKQPVRKHIIMRVASLADDAEAAGPAAPHEPSLAQAVEKLAAEVGGVRGQLDQLRIIALQEARWGRVRPALQALQAKGCAYGRGGDPHSGTTRDMLEWALRRMLAPSSIWINLDDFHRQRWEEEYGSYYDDEYDVYDRYERYGRRQPVEKQVVEQLRSELAELTGLHLVAYEGVFIVEGKD
ncbi:hypothetical protein HXX76_002547 [Chlamydomonas incerta]|uniref:Uncharacterized protein n=1 Tax=Chlamydomonas incerta TaxID=51695 RepID=A0A835TNW4_CHLIN|nr:hypothetical protein HXX76_002547 [Chlamydomonas incerta]|eukprot:KAG2442461.1 hypothetical protein HXX76_002547 [Chlamydomonas incerta]